MHPAFSIIVFTTTSGLGYGLAAMLGAGLLAPDAVSTKVAHVLALALIAAGLLSSTLHLGNPQRAWRAFSQWRTSWLSREGVLAVATFVPLCVSAYLSVFRSAYSLPVGLLGALGAAATVYCTSMIYASLRSVQAWNTPLTSACYLLFAASGGTLFASLFAAMGGGLYMALLVFALVATVAAWMAKIAWRRRMLDMEPLSTPESATGLGPIGKVKLFESPHVNDNYLTREMGFRVARKHAAKLFAIAVGAGGVLPAFVVLMLLVAGFDATASILLLMLAMASHVLGVLVERWLFFAEARHAVMNYYGR